MIHPRKRNGDLIVYFHDLATGRVFIDTREHRVDGELIHRSGPEHPRHYCRFEEYGLADGLLRCKHCGLVKEPAVVV